jgi:hypothetical protein
MGCEGVKEGKVLRGRQVRELPESDVGARDSKVFRDHGSPLDEPEARYDFEKKANCLETFV